MNNDDSHVIRAWKNLACAVLQLAVEDISKGKEVNDAYVFAKGNWAKELCEGVDIEYKRYLNKVESLL